MCAGPMTRSDTAFMGFYAVEPKFQKIGIGRELWAKTVGRLDESINIGLYGVPNMSEKYKRSGFKVEDSIRMLIFESQVGQQLKLDQLRDTDHLPAQCRLEALDGLDDSGRSELLLRKLIDYDHSVQRFPREKLLRNYLGGSNIPMTLLVVRDLSNSERKSTSTTSTTTLCCAKPSQESIIEDEETAALGNSIKSNLMLTNSRQQPNNFQTRTSSPIDISSVSACSSSNELEVLGYGCLRSDNTKGAMIGPVYAESSEIAECILKNLMSKFELDQSEGKFSVMALSSNKQACKLLTKIGLKEMDQCLRMFTKFVPTASLSEVYYVHSPNFTLF